MCFESLPEFLQNNCQKWPGPKKFKSVHPTNISHTLRYSTPSHQTWPGLKNQVPTPHQHLTYNACLNAIPPNTQLGRPTANKTHHDTRIQIQPHTPNPKSAQNSHTLAAGSFKQRRDPYKNSTNSWALRLSVVKTHTRDQIYCRPPENTYAQPDKRWLSTLIFATKCRRELESR